MKRKLLTYVTFVMLSLFVLSCQKDDDTNSNSIATVATQGKWRVTLFSENGVDQTSAFSGYEFSFNTNGSAIATKAATNVNGTWAAGTDDSKQKFILNFGSASLWENISEDWQVKSQTANTITLEHVSGGNGGTDLLTLEKI